MQFGINKHEQIFQRQTKLHEPVGRVQFGVFEKFTSAYLFQIAQEKSCDNLLIIHMNKLLDSDWLRAVQFKCNTSAKSVTPVQKV